MSAFPVAETDALRSANQDFNILLAVTGAMLLLAIGALIGLYFASRRAAVANVARQAAFLSLDRSNRLMRTVAASLERLVKEDDEELARAGLLESAGRFFGLARLRVIGLDPSGQAVRILAGWAAHDSPLAAADEDDRDRFAGYLDAVRNGQTILRESGTRTILLLPLLGSLGGVPRAVLVAESAGPRSWSAEDLDALRTLAFAYERTRERRDSTLERDRFDQRRRELERSELIAQLASGIAHDFNNILFAAGGRLQLLLRKTSDETQRQGIAEVQKILQTASPLISGLLEAHRGTARSLARVELGPEFAQVERLARRLLPSRCDLKFETEGVDGIAVRCDRQGVQQLLLNLVVNARDATDGRGRIRVRAFLDRLADGRDAVRLCVEDDGPGLAPELRARALEPFFTTKAQGQGTGLGLSICQRVAQEAGGVFRLEASSDLGGLRAEALFPTAPVGAAGEDAEGEGEPANPTLADVRTVLVVEDNDIIREVLVRCFEGLGIDCIARGDAREVAAILDEGRWKPDLLVMDIDLPHLTGIECLERLRARGIRIPCLFITGGVSEPPAALAPLRLLHKPFKLESLLEECRLLVDEAKAG